MKDYFTETELECHCGCGLRNTTPKHRSMLNSAREIAGIPFYVTSGSRCVEHNAKVGGKPTSDHLTGEGTDIICAFSGDRYKIIDAAICAGFKRIGIAKTFIHLGSNKDNPQEVLWLY
jgi:zinc D-Ala-D-Ala carboxypeptidase